MNASQRVRAAPRARRVYPQPGCTRDTGVKARARPLPGGSTKPTTPKSRVYPALGYTQVPISKNVYTRTARRNTNNRRSAPQVLMCESSHRGGRLEGIVNSNFAVCPGHPEGGQPVPHPTSEANEVLGPTVRRYWGVGANVPGVRVGLNQERVCRMSERPP